MSTLDLQSSFEEAKKRLQGSQPPRRSDAGSGRLSPASALPWLDLYQAARMRGWRPRTRGLLEAALRARQIA